MDATLSYGFDGAFIGYGGFGGYDTTDEFEIDDLHYRDEWGTVYEKTCFSWPIDAPVDFPIKDRGDLKRYRPPDPDLPERLEEIQLAQELAHGEVAIVGGAQGPLTTSLLLSGLSNVLVSMIDDASFVRDLFTLSNEYFKTAIHRMIEANVDVICIPEDLGFASGPFFSPVHFRKHLLPFIVDLFDEALRAGVPTFLHCDGNINAYLDDLLSIGFHGLHPIQRTAGMSVRGIRETHGTGICIIGNVDSSHTLVYGPDNQVMYETLETIHDGGVEGGLILASDSDLRDEMPLENIDLMFDTALEYGRYPIDIAAIEDKMKECLHFT